MHAGMQRLQEQALQGTVALLAGLGIGLLLKQVVSLVLSGYFFSDAIIFALIVASVFLVYRIVLGIRIEKKRELYVILVLCIIIGTAAAFLARVNHPLLEGDSGDYIRYVSTLTLLGAIVGFPRLRRMAVLALSGFIGGAAGTFVYLQGMDFIYYIKDPKREFINYLANNFGMGMGMTSFVTDVLLLASAAFATLIFSLGIGIAGSSISIAMGSEKEASENNKSAFFDIIRKLGLGIAVFMLFSYAYVLFTGGGESAMTVSGVSIDTDNKTAIVYVPVFIDGKGAALDVYKESKIFGNATYEIVDTDYGKAMKVTGNGNILVFTKHPDGAKRSNSEVNRYLRDFGLGMSDFMPFGGDATQIPPVKIMPKTGAWIYSDSEVKFLGLMLGRDSGVGISYSMDFPYYDRSKNMMVPANLTRGWQRIELETTIRRYQNFI